MTELPSGTVTFLFTDVQDSTRLWQSQGKIAEAREQLSMIYNWFAEGFDTVDLKEAKALLDKLA